MKFDTIKTDFNTIDEFLDFINSLGFNTYYPRKNVLCLEFYGDDGLPKNDNYYEITNPDADYGTNYNASSNEIDMGDGVYDHYDEIAGITFENYKLANKNYYHYNPHLYPGFIPDEVLSDTFNWEKYFKSISIFEPYSKNINFITKISDMVEGFFWIICINPKIPIIIPDFDLHDYINYIRHGNKFLNRLIERQFYDNIKIEENRIDALSSESDEWTDLLDISDIDGDPDLVETYLEHARDQRFQDPEWVEKYNKALKNNFEYDVEDNASLDYQHKDVEENVGHFRDYVAPIDFDLKSDRIIYSDDPLLDSGYYKQTALYEMVNDFNVRKNHPSFDELEYVQKFYKIIDHYKTDKDDFLNWLEWRKNEENIEEAKEEVARKIEKEWKDEYELDGILQCIRFFITNLNSHLLKQYNIEIDNVKELPFQSLLIPIDFITYDNLNDPDDFTFHCHFKLSISQYDEGVPKSDFKPFAFSENEELFKLLVDMENVDFTILLNKLIFKVIEKQIVTEKAFKKWNTLIEFEDGTYKNVPSGMTENMWYKINKRFLKWFQNESIDSDVNVLEYPQLFVESYNKPKHKNLSLKSMSIYFDMENPWIKHNLKLND